MDYLNLIDKVYVIHCAENKKRLENINFQKQHNKWLNDKLEIWWTCYYSHSDIMANAMLLSNKSRYVSNKSELNLTREFYCIIKTSYLRGFNYICIFEDDFSLMKERLFDKMMNAMPSNLDIVQLSYLADSDDILLSFKELYSKYQLGVLWIDKPSGGWSNNGVIFSRRGMKYFIDSIDKEFQAADIPQHESKNKAHFYGHTQMTDDTFKHYIPTMPLVYVNGQDSSVQTEDKTDIYSGYSSLDIRNYNLYS